MDTTDLIGKHLLIYTQGVELEHATFMRVDRVEDISGRLFLIGIQPHELLGRENWQSRMETFMAWDTVTQFHIFEDYDSFQTVCQSSSKEGWLGLFRGT